MGKSKKHSSLDYECCSQDEAYPKKDRKTDRKRYRKTVKTSLNSKDLSTTLDKIDNLDKKPCYFKSKCSCCGGYVNQIINSNVECEYKVCFSEKSLRNPKEFIFQDKHVKQMTREESKEEKSEREKFEKTQSLAALKKYRKKYFK